MELLLKVIPADNILFASEIIGAVQGIDPETGFAFDDTKRYIDEIEWLPRADRDKILHGNTTRVYPRLASTLEERFPANASRPTAKRRNQA